MCILRNTRPLPMSRSSTTPGAPVGLVCLVILGFILLGGCAGGEESPKTHDVTATDLD